ncbi:hypothetical protein AX774_g266 [Zancudomyces culisetae]|uniref:Mitochondrial outer membrane transport complex Sam37/metaxin N-terminal domain-containing protein n=1 Tax=Zancudomyces culisetae TaxID=1213189 RepID=A0A1R1PYW4_ZANCU|nr:hypothetical protein AX774_g266 [Zancudomyces culisetae]|eukprot:OMH86152.1 hypothetical protein AX774_g266 [Zancudomyces culisetae]
MEEDNNQSFNIFTDISNCLKELKTPRVTFEPLYKPVVNDLPIIYVYPPTAGSSRWFDVASFFFVNIVKERDLKYEIRYTVDSEASPDGKLPYIMLQDTTCLTTEAALARLVEECDKLSDSTGEEKSPSVEAFIHLIKTTLTPAIQLCIWSQKEFVREIVQTFSAHNGCTKQRSSAVSSRCKENTRIWWTTVQT